MSVEGSQATTPGPRVNRWLQLLLAVLGMLAISSPQYTWAIFSTSFIETLDVKVSELSVTMTVFSVCMFAFGPLYGFLLQRMRVSLYVAIGGVLIGLGWALSAFASSLLLLYLSYGMLCGVGAGMVYLACMDLSAQWFPDRRGLALGLVSAGYSIGAMVSTFPIIYALKSNGLDATLLASGLAIGILIVLASISMRKRLETDVVPVNTTTPMVSTRSYSPREILTMPSYWLLFTMMTLVAIGGMMVIAQMGHFAPSFGITPEVQVWGIAALPLALTVSRFANGITRPLFGWISDHLGRENTMAFAFAMEGLTIYALLIWGHDPLMFVILISLVFLGWGEIFSLFPATLADMFGPAHQPSNLGFLLMSIALASFFGGPLAGLIYEAFNSWTPVFVIVSCFDLMAAALAVFVLKPMRRRDVGANAQSMDSGATLVRSI
ncbi:MAG: oxalate/formate MFS antiporter [Halioglobus sp.]